MNFPLNVHTTAIRISTYLFEHRCNYLEKVIINPVILHVFAMRCQIYYSQKCWCVIIQDVYRLYTISSVINYFKGQSVCCEVSWCDTQYSCMNSSSTAARPSGASPLHRPPRWTLVQKCEIRAPHTQHTHTWLTFPHVHLHACLHSKHTLHTMSVSVLACFSHISSIFNSWTLPSLQLHHFNKVAQSWI